MIEAENTFPDTSGSGLKVFHSLVSLYSQFTIFRVQYEIYMKFISMIYKIVFILFHRFAAWGTNLYLV